MVESLPLILRGKLFSKSRLHFRHRRSNIYFAPLYEEESEDPHAFCAVFICDADLISGAEELFRNALHASVTVDRLMAAREKAEAF